MGTEALLGRRAFIAGALLLVLSGCAGGGGVKGFPPLEAGKGRVFMYRTSSFGSVYTPDVLLNGERVGKLDKPAVFYSDVPPGSYAVTTTKTSRVANFAVRAGEKKYVRLSSGFFETQMHPELVDPAKGESECSGLEVLPQKQK